jgi:hypothetical protein
MDDLLRVDLWNAIYEEILGKLPVRAELKELWTEVLRQPVDQFTENSAVQTVKGIILTGADWHLVCNILQFWADRIATGWVDQLTARMNSAFHRGKFAWHFVGRQLLRYIGEAETKAISVALQDSQPFPEVRKQLDIAFTEFSAREDPNYGHAAKEAISAVETLVKQVVGDPAITLGDGLKKIRQSGKPAVHGALVSSFENLWGYASNKGYLRHGGTPGEGLEGVTMEEAQLVLVSCAAIISFLIARAQAEGILGAT